jgi:hypothetical protein
MKWNIHRIFCLLITAFVMTTPAHGNSSAAGKKVSLTRNSTPMVSLNSIPNIGKTQQAIFSPDGYTLSISSQTNPGFISVLYGSSFTSYSLSGHQSVVNGPQDQTMDNKYIYAAGNTGKIWQLPYVDGLAGTLQTINPTPTSANNQIYCLSLMGNYLYAGNTWGSAPAGGLVAVEIAANGAMSNVFGGSARSTWGTILLGCTPDATRDILFLTSYPYSSTSTNTLWALDVSSPTSPTTLASIDLTPYNTGGTVVWASVEYDGSRYLYLTPDHTDSASGANTNQLLVIDTLNLASATPSMTPVAHLVNQLQNPYPSLRHAVVFLDSTTIMVTSAASGGGYVTYFDVTNPAAPLLLGNQLLNSDLVGAAVNPDPLAQPPFVAGVLRTSNEVVFYDINVELTVTANGDGTETISPAAPQTVNYGETQAFKVNANDGYALSNVVGGTCPVGNWTGDTYTTGTITSACTVNFSALPTIPSSLAGSPSINPHLVCCGRPIILGPLSAVPGNGPTIYSVIGKTGPVKCVIENSGSQTYLKVDGNNGSCTIVATKEGVTSTPLTITSQGRT